MYFDFVYGIFADTRGKTNRESARIRPSGKRIGFADPPSRNPATLSCSSLIGNVRANPVGAPAPPVVTSSYVKY